MVGLIPGWDTHGGNWLIFLSLAVPSSLSKNNNKISSCEDLKNAIIHCCECRHLLLCFSYQIALPHGPKHYLWLRSYWFQSYVLSPWSQPWEVNKFILFFNGQMESVTAPINTSANLAWTSVHRDVLDTYVSVSLSISLITFTWSKNWSAFYFEASDLSVIILKWRPSEM